MQATQVVLLKIGSITAIVSIIQWIAIYSYLEPSWRKGPIGRSLVLFAVYAMVTPALLIVSLFFRLNRLNTQAVAWVEIVLLLAAIPAGMAWRSVIWWRASRSGDEGRLPAGECHHDEPSE